MAHRTNGTITSVGENNGQWHAVVDWPDEDPPTNTAYEITPEEAAAWMVAMANDMMVEGNHDDGPPPKLSPKYFKKP